MKLIAPTLLIMISGLGVVLAQDKGPVRCAVGEYKLQGEDGKLVNKLEFAPKIAEEELTTTNLRLSHGDLFVVASVFPTDESMHSASGYDSLKLGIATSRKPGRDAFAIVNSAAAEVPLSTLDTARVERYFSHGGRRMILRLECWDTERVKRKTGG